MADSILTTAAFATAFMKPVPGETIDAIYGRKIADNTGYLYYKPEKIADFSGNSFYYADSSKKTWTGTSIGYKYDNKNTVFGTVAGTLFFSAGTGTWTASFTANGTTLYATSSHQVSGPVQIVFATSYSCSVSSLSSGAVIPIIYSAAITGAPSVGYRFDIDRFDAWNKA